MKQKLLFFLFIICIIAEGYTQSDYSQCDRISITAASAKPSFNDFLTGIKYATILEKPKIDGYIPAFNALIQY